MITLHCGLHKTGTSSIQFALRRARLRGVVVPRVGDDQSDGGWQERLRRLSKGGLLSDEKLLGNPFDGYAQAPARLDIVRKTLGDRPRCLVVYLRPQPDWLESVYLQGVQQGRLEGPEEFWSRVRDAPFLQWSALLDLLEASGGAREIVVRPFGDNVDVVRDFALTCGLPSAVGQSQARANVSISAIQAPVLRSLSASQDLSPAERGQLRSAFQHTLAPGAPNGWSAFPEAIQREILDRTRADWLAVSARVGRFEPEAGTRFEVLQGRWKADIRAFPTEDVVQEEMMRSLRVLASTEPLPAEIPLGLRVVKRLQRYARSRWA